MRIGITASIPPPYPPSPTHPPTRRYRTPNIAQVRRRMSAASAPLAGSSTTSALLSASLPRPTAPTALESLHRHRTLISSPSSAIILLSSSDGRPYALKLAKAAETGGETDRETDGETGGKTGGETDRQTDAELNPQRADDGLATTSARAHAADGRRIKGGNAACTGGSGNSTGGSGTRAYSAASVVQRLHRELLALHAVSKSETAQLSTSSLTTTTTTTTTTASTSCEGFDSFIVRAYGACRLGATHVATLFEWLPGGSLSGLLERQVHVLSLVPTPFFGSHVSVSYSYESVSPSIPLIRFFPLDSTNQGKLSHAGARFYIGCAALGVAELHKLGIAHRDIKPANLVSIQLTRAP